MVDRVRIIRIEVVRGSINNHNDPADYKIPSLAIISKYNKMNYKTRLAAGTLKN
jgi:hypothetical protein